MLTPIRKLYGDSLFRNSFFIMSATAVLAVFGFFFWLVVARLFATSDIGLATALISVMNFITYLSLIGFNVAFVRFLPKSKTANDEINTGMILVAIAAGLFSIACVILIPLVSPSLSFVRTRSVGPAFVAFCILASLNILTEAFFLASRNTKFTLITNTIFSVIKMGLPFLFIGAGAVGIFAAAASAQAIGFMINVSIMMRKFDYRPRFVIDAGFLAREWKYCAGNYTASIFNLLPVAVLPLLITNHLGPESAAYYYMVMMIGNMLYVIPTATTRSLLAEGSRDEKHVAASVKMAIGFIALLLVPSILVLLFGASMILRIFGEAYTEGAHFLQLVALTGILVSGSSILSALFQIKKDTRAVIISNSLSAAATIGFGYVFMPLGLTGVGYALIIGSLVSNIAGFVLYNKFTEAVNFFDEIFYSEWARLKYKVAYVRARWRIGGPSTVVLFYPQRPQPFHMAYLICHRLGYKITNDPSARYDTAIAFEDTEVRLAETSLADLCAGRDMINGQCGDISKARVGEIFEKVFGYGTTIDPRTYRGLCVRKSNSNAVHDGKVIECPCAPEAGYIYQKLINNQYGGDKVQDIRITICKETISLAQRRFRSLHDRFDNTRHSDVVDVDAVLRPEEQEKVIAFCKAFGLEYGDLDILRDIDDGKIYIVDVNNAPSGPRPGVHMTKSDYEIFMQRLCTSFTSSFVLSR